MTMPSTLARQATPARQATLADLPPGVRATVLGIADSTDPAIAQRLHALGFTPGVPVEAIRRAPLRDPVIYRVQGYDICLRRAQAVCVHTAEAR